MAAMFLPEVLSSHGTIGTTARANGHGTLPGSSMPLPVIKTTLFPDWWGRESAFEAPDVSAGVPNYNERTLYAGVVALLLALVGLLRREQWRERAPFAALAVLGLAIPLHAPVLYWLVTHL